MRLHRFIGDFDLDAPHIAHRDAGLANQIRNVLRLEVGDEVALCDGKGHDARAKIAAMGAAVTEFDVSGKTENRNDPDAAVVLYCAILKKENFELVLQKATEAGAARIVPLRTARTVKLDVRADRAAKIVREAAEQSGRGTVPTVSAPLAFAAALDDAALNAANVLFDLGAPALKPSTFAGVTSIGVFIGPEGGWEPEEVSAAKERGVSVLGLGPRTLRAETAAIVATYLAAGV